MNERPLQAQRPLWGRRFLPGLVLAALVLFGLIAYGDARQLWADIKGFSWWLLFPILGCVFLNYVARWSKWHFYLKVLGVELDRQDSFLVFLGGLVMCLTPAKLGEALKGYFVWRMKGIAMTRVAPVVVAERFTDFVAIAVLASIGVTMLPGGIFLMGSIFLVLVLFLLVLGRRQWILAALAVPQRGRLARVAEGLREVYESVSLLLSPRNLFLPIAVSIPAWWLECLAFDMVLTGLGSPVRLIDSTVCYAFSTLVGALSMLPGGLGSTEAIMVKSLDLLSASESTAAAATLIARACTLWFAVLVGAFVCLVFQTRLTTRQEERHSAPGTKENSSTGAGGEGRSTA